MAERRLAKFTTFHILQRIQRALNSIYWEKISSFVYTSPGKPSGVTYWQLVLRETLNLNLFR